MTFDPPAGPPAGWYPDPEHPGHQRWWDGRAWAPAHLDAVAERDYPDVGGLLGRSFTRALRHWRSFALVALVTTVVSGVLVSIMFRVLARDLVVTDDGDLLGWTNDRLLPAIALFLVAVALGMIGYLAAAVLALRAVDIDGLADPRRSGVTVTTSDEVTVTKSVLATTVRLLPRAIGWYLVLTVVAMAAMVVVFLLFVAAVPLGVLAMLGLIPLAAWLLIKYAFVNFAIAEGPGNPFPRSAQVVQGRWWATFGRLFVVGLVTSVISFGVNGSMSAAGGGNFFDSGPTIEFGEDGFVDRVDIDEFTPSVASIVFGAIGTLVAAVFTTGVQSLAMADMYRTRRQRRVA